MSRAISALRKEKTFVVAMPETLDACPARAADCCQSRADRFVYLRAAQAYMLISMPTGSSTIFGVFQLIRVSQVVWHDVRAGFEPRSGADATQVRWTGSEPCRAMSRPIFLSWTRPDFALGQWFRVEKSRGIVLSSSCSHCATASGICELSMRRTSFERSLAALFMFLSDAAGSRRRRPTPSNRPNAATSPATLTGKERLGPRWMDEQRIDNCKVPIDKRGTKPRASTCPHVPMG